MSEVLKGTFLLLIALLSINKSKENCLLKCVAEPVWTPSVQSYHELSSYSTFDAFHQYSNNPPPFMFLRNIPPSLYTPIPKYLECQNETITKDFQKKIIKLYSNSIIQRLEISNVYNEKLEMGVFTFFNTVSVLRINHGNIESIQDGTFRELTHMTEFQLRNNKIYKISAKCFANLTKLSKVDLSFNNIGNIDDTAFDSVSNLRELNISHNLLLKLTKTMFKNSKLLEKLDLSNNIIYQLDSNIFETLTNLSVINLHHNHLKEIDKKLFANNKKLNNLDISYNYLSHLNFIFFPSINSVKITNNYIKIINFFYFTQIEILDLSSNKITLSNYSFRNLAVKKIYLENNLIGISSSLEDFSNLTSPKRIALSNNDITDLNANMFENFTQLEEVYLGGNYLNCLSRFPRSLKVLSVRNNFLDSSIIINYLINLQILDLSFNNITIISFHFFDNLKFLLDLRLQNNNIYNLDVGCFRNAKFLLYLNLSNNKITTLEFGTFIGINRLKYLDLSHNNLNVISDGVFFNLRNLYAINAAYNNISFISAENTLSHMYLLKEINLAGNQLSCSFLTKFITNFKNIKLVKESDNSLTNVNNIACHSKISDNKSLVLVNN